MVRKHETKKRKISNEVLAIYFFTWMAIIVILHGAGIINIPEYVLGSIITLMFIIIQHYFRKRPSLRRIRYFTRRPYHEQQQ